MIPITLPHLGTGPGGGLGLVDATDTVRVAAPLSADPSDQGWVDQQPGAYGSEILCSVDDLRAKRMAGLAPTGVEDFKLTCETTFGVTQNDQAIEWVSNALGELDPPFVLRSVGREIPPNSASPYFTVYATGRD